ncbi:MAG: hypothetical protein HYY09_09045 [Firmicutes bacterium]|nr:hypothetical protein [Bacillota bacterium]
MVGAGFASGQEVLQFFGFFGLTGYAGLAVAAALFVFFGYLVLELGYQTGAVSHLKVVRRIGGRFVGTALDWLIVFFLFGALSAMAAGSGAIFQQQLGFPSIFGSLLMVAFAVLTVLTGLRGVISAISLVTPFLLAAVLGLGIYTLVTIPPNLQSVEIVSDPAKAPVPIWPLSALVYVSFNLVLSVSVLAPLGAAADKGRDRRLGALFGGLGLGLGAMAVHTAVLSGFPRSAVMDVPMGEVAARFGAGVGVIYSVVLLAEVYTTAVADLYGFTARFFDPGSRRFKAAVIGVGLAALGASQIGFTTIVRVVYSAVGYAGLVFLGALVVAFIRRKQGRPD